MNTTNNNKSENSALQLLQDIKSGTTDPKLLDKQTRQQCIETLLGEGYSCSQIAQIFKRSEKTISRDLGDIRQKNSLSPNIQFAKETVGELATKARIHSSYLMRLARDKDSPTGSKAEAEFLAWRVVKELVEKLQTLGFLPLKPQEISGDIYHHIGIDESSESLEEAKKMLSEIELVAKDTNTFSPELAENIKALSERIEKAEIVSDVKKVVEKQKETQEEKIKNE